MPGNDSLKKIKEAEAEAARIRDDAVKSAGKLAADSRAAADERYGAAVKAAEEQKKAALDAVRAKAAAASEEEKKDAMFEAERLYNRAQRYREAALRFICTEVDKKCQS